MMKVECVKGLISKGIQEEAEYWRFSIEKLSKEQAEKIKETLINTLTNIPNYHHQPIEG